MSQRLGMVYLVGAGPGDPGLITVRGLELLRQAGVVIHDRLVSAELLAEVRPDALLIDAAKAPGNHKLTQDQINAAIIEHACTGVLVVRLKGGDPFIYGRGWEELQACREAGIPCAVVPGLSSALAVPAAADIPLTLRDVARTFAVATAQDADESGATGLNFTALAALDTVVVLMGRAKLRDVLTGFLQAGRDPGTPVACIQRGTTPDQRVVVGTLASAADLVERDQLESPMVTVIGEVARCATFGWQRRAGPLVGRRIVITRPAASATLLRHQLISLGAVVINCPVIDIHFPEAMPELDQAIHSLDHFDWLVFTSNHGVEGFWRRLSALGRDARALYGKKLAVIGSRTARALATHGLSADVQPCEGTADALLDVLRPLLAGRNSRILLPRSDIAGSELPLGLRACGAEAVEVVAYHTIARTPPAKVRQELERGVDAVLLYSPSAVRRFMDLGVRSCGGIVGCIGPTTAQAARQAGMTVDLIADQHDDAGMVSVLQQYFDRVR